MKKALFKFIILILLVLGGTLLYADQTSYYWKEIRKIIAQRESAKSVIEATLPSPEGEREMTYDWKYQGRSYSLTEKLYESYFHFYNALPVAVIFDGETEKDWQEKNNAMFVSEIPGDATLDEMIQSFKSLGEKNKLSENELAELVVAFAQTIPYDYEELENIDSGTHKVDYPYEVLFKNKGICSDKSFLTYLLLKKLGYGVSFFLFPEDRHIAVGVKCSQEYSNYDSGYCFVETTSVGNKIGVIPELLPQNRIALANQEIGAFGTDQMENQAQPLGKMEILNEIPGKEYTGVIDTFKTQKEIDNLKITLDAKNRELKVLARDVQETENDLSEMEKKLKSLEKKKDYEAYNDLVSKYNKVLSGYKKEIKSYNQKVDDYNQLSSQYNRLIKSF